MEKVLVEVFAPTLGKAYDMFIPCGVPMHQVLELIKKAVSDLSAGQFLADENTALCYRADGNIININLSAYELGIHNGSKLMLI